MSDTQQSRTCHVQTISEDALRRALRWGEHTGAFGGWSVHPPEGDKPLHFHLVLAWDSPRHWGVLRREVNRMDEHSYVGNAGPLRRAIRYLRHLDAPDKATIPPEDCHAVGVWPPGQWDVIMSPDRQLGAIVEYIRTHARDGPIQIAAGLITEGYKPHQVGSVLRLIDGIRKFLQQP